MYILLLISLTFGAVTLYRVSREYRSRSQLQPVTTIMLYMAYALIAASIAAAAWTKAWPMPLHQLPAGAIGLAMLLAGASISGAAFAAFRSFRRMSGMRQDRLIRSGVYRFSRNPQNVGLALMGLGIAVAGRSILALLLIGVLLGVYHVYLLKVEEPYLLGVFQDQYRQYQSATPRYLGWPALRSRTQPTGAEDGPQGR